jgi:hypothetical protein
VIETGIKALEDVVKGQGKAAIERQVDSLAKLSAALATKANAQCTSRADSPPWAAGQGERAPNGDSVVDAEFEEVSNSDRS